MARVDCRAEKTHLFVQNNSFVCNGTGICVWPSTVCIQLPKWNYKLARPLCVRFIHFSFFCTFIKCLDCHIQLSLEEFWAVFQHLLCFSLSLIIVVHYLRNHIFFGCLLDMECIVLSAFSDPQLFAMRSIAKTKRKKMWNDLDDFTCFHSTLSIISAPGPAVLSVIGGRNSDTYCKYREKGNNK